MTTADARAALRVPFTVNQGVDDVALTNIGKAAQRSAFDAVLALLFQSPTGPLPVSGFVGPSSFFPALDTGLDVTVGGGVALYDRDDLGGIDPTVDPYAPTYTPMFNRGAHAITLDAHSVAARWDVIGIRPDDTEGDLLSREVLDGTGIVSTSLPGYVIDGVEWVVTKGTSGGGVPTAPADTLTVAHVLVPAVAGDVEVFDERRMVPIGDGLADSPTIPFNAQGVVIFGLVVSEGTGLTVDVAAGSAITSHSTAQYTSGGVRRVFVASTLDIAANGTANPRVDTVYVRAGRIKVATGTPDATDPRPPTINAADVPLAHVYVAAGATSLSSGDITDARALRPYRASHQAMPVVYAGVTLVDVTAGSPKRRDVTFYAQDADGVTFAGTVFFAISLETEEGALPVVGEQYFDSPSVGTVVLGTAGATSADRLIVQSNSSGGARIAVMNTTLSDVTLLMRITPMDATVANASTSTNVYEPLTRAYRPGVTSAVVVNVGS